MDKKIILIKIGKGIALIFLLIFVILSIRTFSFSLLRTFGYSLLVLTIGVILDSKLSWGRKLLKYMLYVAYAVYTLWDLGVIANIQILLDLDTLDWTTFTLGFIAPLCMMAVGKRIMAIAIKGYKIFNYYTLWLIYLVLGIIWWTLYPGDVILSLLITYFLITIIIVYYFNLKNRGM